MHENISKHDQCLSMVVQLYYPRVILALQHEKRLRNNKIDDILKRFRGVGKLTLQKLKNGRVRD